MIDLDHWSLLSVAMERRDWELAALCIVLGAIEMAQELPPDASDEMIDLLAAEKWKLVPRRRRKCRERRR